MRFNRASREILAGLAPALAGPVGICWGAVAGLDVDMGVAESKVTVPLPLPFDYPGEAAGWCDYHAKGPCSVRVWWIGRGDTVRLTWPFDWDREGWEDEYLDWEERYGEECK